MLEADTVKTQAKKVRQKSEDVPVSERAQGWLGGMDVDAETILVL
jgi:hypothetical protein